MNRLQQLYQDKIQPTLQKELGLSNPMAVPKLTKVIINLGIGDAAKDKGVKDKILHYIGQMAGQKPQIRPAKKSIAEFGVRQGDAVGIRVTLRGARAYEFLDKLISIVLPRVRDFQGIKRNAFDQQGNYNLGLREQIIFPEVEYDTIDRIRGLQITVGTSAQNPGDAFKLLSYLGMPFEK